MINVGELITDPDFAQPGGFTVTRQTGAWVAGRFETTSEELEFQGTILPLNTKDLDQIPEGDRVTGGIKIYTRQPLYTTQLDDSNTGDDGNLSDEVTWSGELWKILQVQAFNDYGYYKSIAVRKLGA